MAQIRLKHYGTPLKALQVIFKSSQTYTIESKWKSCDVFLVGGGAGGMGSNMNVSRDVATGGGGAGAGYTNTYKNIDITNSNRTIIVTIGAGGAGGAIGGTSGEIPPAPGQGGETKIEITINGTSTTYNALGGANNYSSGTRKGGSNGGDPAVASSSGTANAKDGGTDGTPGQGRTTKAFEETDGTIYAGGGGGGGAEYENNSGSIKYVMPSGTHGAGSGTNMGGGGNGGNAILSKLRSIFKNYNGNAGDVGIAIIRFYKDNNRPTDIDWSKCTITL